MKIVITNAKTFHPGWNVANGDIFPVTMTENGDLVASTTRGACIIESAEANTGPLVGWDEITD